MDTPTTTPIDLGAIQARADHSAALPDVTDKHESPTDCRRCNVGLRLLDGCEWPVDGPLCGTCTDDERLEAIADRAALLTEVRRLRADALRARVVGLQEAAAFLNMAAEKMEAGGIEDAPAGDVVAALIEGLMARAADGFEDELSAAAKAEIAAPTAS